MRIAVILARKSHVESFLISDSYESLSNSHEVHLFLAETIRNFVPANLLHRCYFVENLEHDSKIVTFYQEILTWKNRHKSKSFKFRHFRHYPGLLWVINQFIHKRNAVSNEIGGSDIYLLDAEQSQKAFCRVSLPLRNYLRVLYINVVKKYIIQILGTPGITEICRLFLRIDGIRKPQLLNLLSNNFNLICYVTNGYETLSSEIVSIGKSLDVPTFFLIDNWDNLSSKSCLNRLPSYVSTWGPQSTKHACIIQGYRPNQIFEIGSMRFTCLGQNSHYSGVGNFQDRYVLFLGSYLYFDEVRFLEILSDEIRNAPDVYGDLKIIYRPHPKGTWTFSHVPKSLLDIIKPETWLFDNSDSLIREPEHKRNMHRYSILLNKCLFAVGGLTTALLELALFKKRYVCLDHNELWSSTSPSLVRSNYEHFKELPTLDYIYFSSSIEAFPIVFRNNYVDSVAGYDSELTFDVSNFVNVDVTEFNSRLLSALNQIDSIRHEN